MLLATAAVLALCGVSGINFSVGITTVAACGASITAAGGVGEAATGLVIGTGDRFDGMDAGKDAAAGT